MDSIFTSEFFTNNRKKLRQSLDLSAPIILTANGLVQRNSDISYPFRQDSNFWYLTGIEDPDLILVIDSDEEYFITPKRDETRLVFDGQIDVDKNTKISGVSLVLDEDTGWDKLSGVLKKPIKTYVIQPPDIFDRHHGLYANPAQRALHDRLKEVNPETELVDIRKQFAQLRMIKQKPEIQAIQNAVKITTDAFTYIKNNLGDFTNEKQIQNKIDNIFSERYRQHAYLPIVAGGKNACTLHYIDNNQDLFENNLVLIDAGAEWQNYASDITRTYARGTVSKRQQDVFDAVVEVQDFAMRMLKPGAELKNSEQKIEKFMGKKLKELGLIKSINSTNVRKYYPHSTSHFLGLDTHDAGDYRHPLQPGMVLTVEPGIYIPEESIGIRIEDDVLITENGNDNLSRSLPRNLV